MQTGQLANRNLSEQTLSALTSSVEQQALNGARWLMTSADVLPITLAVSIVFHAFLLLITFAAPDSPGGKIAPQLDVVLVNSQSASRPVDAELLAQANLDGGGNTRSDLRAKSSLPALEQMQPTDALELSSRRVEQLEHNVARLLAAAGNGIRLDEAKPVTNRLPETVSNDQQLGQAKREQIARLEAEIAKEWQAYQKLPRRKFIGARAEQAVYAEYVERWRRLVEAVGTRNYPQEARRQQLFGTLLLTVSIKADGSVEQIELDRSSGHSILDRSALRIVELAGPFPPFPAAIRDQYDILSITRQWSFTRNDLGIAVAQ